MGSSRKRPGWRFPLIPLATLLLAGLFTAATLLITLPEQSTPGGAELANAPLQITELALQPQPREEPANPGHDVDGLKAAEPLLNPDPLETLDTSAAVQGGEQKTVVVKKGDTLSDIFTRLDLYSDLFLILKPGKDHRALKRIHPGQKLVFTVNGSRLERLELVQSPSRSLVYSRHDDSFVAKTLHRPLDTILQYAHGHIDSSLYLAGHKAGMSDALIHDLVLIFRWDIDFALDLRVGDSFAVLYEKHLLDGEEVDEGEIVAAEFVNRGITHRAYRYTDASGRADYYTLEGKSLHRSFLRTPVELARISSHFNPRRRHPILNVVRAHKGVDYAAPTGTPIKATGTGRVIYRGTKGQYGKTIVLRHGNIYSTLYAHMSRYARGTGVGRTVKQGQTIGYVGSTGLSTGPHLHYEFRVNGVHRNPLKVKLPQTKSLPKAEMDRFLATVQAPARQLDAYAINRLALQDL